MRSRLAPWVAFLTFTAAGAAAGAGYALTAPKHYRATAQLIVAPVSPSDPTFAGIGVLRDTGGRRTAAASVAALVRSPQIVDAAAASLAIRRSRNSLLHALDAHVVDSSDVVAVTASDGSARGAAQLANTFANALVSQRTAAFQNDLAAAIHRDTQLLAGMSTAQREGDAGAAVSRRLATLTALQGRPDPTVSVASQAVAPASASWPNVWRTIAIGAAIGAGAGALVALGLLLLQRSERRRPAVYDPGVSDEQALERLIERLEGRLAARESALAVRERDVQAKIDELRAASEAAPDLDDLERRERDVAEQEAELDRRRGDLDERVATVTKREVELARRSAELAEAERERAAERRREAERERQAEREPEPEPEPPPAPARARPRLAVDGRGRYNLVALERLVAEYGPDHPNRVEEWSSYLYFLREYAEPDGTVPTSFDSLIEDAFGELEPDL